MAQIKTKEEINKIKNACKITDAIFLKILKLENILPKLTEIELRDFILNEIKKKNLKPSFPPIVSGGGRAGDEIHPESTGNKLKGFVIIDFGVIYEKYMSDMTRTIFIGKPTKADIKVYNRLLNAQNEALERAKPGIPCGYVDQETRADLGDLAKYFIHTLGHGVGTKIHEEPKLYYKNMRPKLKENMVITIEPGLYVAGEYGMRIEDTCVITSRGCVSLTKSKKDLIVIK